MNCIVVSSATLHITHNDSDALGCALVVNYNHMKSCKMNKDETNEYDEYGYGFPKHSFNSIESAKYNIDLVIKVLDRLYSNNEIDKDDLYNFKQLTFYEYNDCDVLAIPGTIIISDLAVDSDKLCMLNMLCGHFDINILYVDHHTSNLHNNQKYKWCHVKSTDEKGELRSACKFLFELLDLDNDKTKIIDNYKALKNLIDDISRYDTWLWKTDPIDYREEYATIIIKTKGIDNAFHQIARELFIDKTIEYSLLDIPDYQLYIDTYINKRNNYIEKCFKNTVIDIGRNLEISDSKFSDLKYALVILPDDFSNDIMEAIYNNYDIDIVIGIHPSTKTLTFRRSYNCNADLSELAKRYGGGGHESASGARLCTISFIKLLERYYTLLDMNEISNKK